MTPERRAEVLAFWEANHEKLQHKVMAKRLGIPRDMLYRITQQSRKSKSAQLSERNEAVYRFLILTFSTDLRWPSVMEIHDRLKISHPTMVYRSLKELEDQGYIRREKGSHRSIAIPGLSGRLARIIESHCREHFHAVRNGTRRSRERSPK